MFTFEQSEFSEEECREGGVGDDELRVRGGGGGGLPRGEEGGYQQANTFKTGWWYVCIVVSGLLLIV